ncbi:MAG: hypothetical protein KKG09_04520 [Verrucomicrobia bacterium]|nr:hypothetical protein [Verrucomicrobiota bacterium]MBU4289437.1 hypothetical protein [Verrucomicrobiota bacterium]MBU4429318.1 hypothetical protein [Verrucomicrobiota bacterium]MBU4497251.1 hypothetical protein [Verrucomicrobiota bacterium]MCG2679144.1 hypothetical protein [Kiritimatiellia bacterium]
MKKSVFVRSLKITGVISIRVLCGGLTLAQGQSYDNTNRTIPAVFTMPQRMGDQQVLQNQIQILFLQHRFEEAEQALTAAIRRHPRNGINHYNLACVQAQLNKSNAAFENLALAIANGFSSVNQFRLDSDLDAMRSDRRFGNILEKIEKQTASNEAAATSNFHLQPIKDGVAMISESNVIWDAQAGVFRVVFSLDPAPGEPSAIVKGQEKAGELIRAWQQEGTACGLDGVLYDNRDKGHSLLNLGNYPQLTRVTLSPGLKDIGLFSGIQASMLYNFPTIGNSSTAMTQGPYWRGLSRLAMVNAAMMTVCYYQYMNNMVYFYPEHHDYDAGHNGKGGYGDTYPANCPYFITSQGSSGSDRPFMNAVACTLASFGKETRQALVLSGTLMPAVQMIMRHSLKTVLKPEDYLSGKAHPPVFSAAALDVEKMVRMAHDMQPTQIPPSVQLQVVDEDLGIPGIDYFHHAAREALFDTPGAIARVMRSVKCLHRVVVSAESSRDINGRPLTYHWVVLCGDKTGINIRPLNKAGSSVEILVPYHERRPIAPGSTMESTRVDIGAFVHNGVYYSAPAFVSFYYLDNEKRVYDTNKRIQSVEYKSQKEGGSYADPAIDMPKDWRDDYRYDGQGRLTGWMRTRGKNVEEFTVDGLLVVEKDARGRALKARNVRYAVSQTDPQSPGVLMQENGSEIMTYMYTSNDDRIGRIVSRSKE